MPQIHETGKTIFRLLPRALLATTALHEAVYDVGRYGYERGGGPVRARLDPRDNYPPCNKQRPISQEFLRVSGRKGRASLRTMRFPFFAAGKRVRTSVLDIGECKAALSAPVLGFLFCRWAPAPISTDLGEGDRYPLTSQQ